MRRLGFFIILVILGTTTLWSQEMSVPIDVQYSLFLKILTFDRNLKSRVGNQIVIGVIYQGKFRKSVNVKDDLISVIDKSPIKNIEDIPIRYALIDIGEEANLDSSVLRINVDILYITPLRAVEIKKITDITRTKRIMTLTGVTDYVESGLSVGIGTKGEKPLIIINLPAAKKEGVDFSSQLLKIAKVIE